MVVIKSKGFILRPYRKGDEESLIKNINDRDIYKYTLRIPCPYTKKHAKQWIESTKKKDKTKVNFAIDLNDEVIGGVGFEIKEPHRAEIGYWLGIKYWNQNIMTEAIKLVTQFGFDKLKLRRIEATIDPKNKASARVLLKNGYKFEGLLKNYHIKKGKMLDVLMYAKVK